MNATKDDDFEAMDCSLRAVRKRPLMYVGPLDNPAIPTTLLLGLLYQLRHEAAKVRVELFAGGLVDVLVEGAAWTKTVATRRITEIPCGVSSNREDHEYVDITVVNALSSNFDFTSCIEDAGYFILFRNGGMPVVRCFQGSHETWMRFLFTLDDKLFPNADFDAETLRAWISKHSTTTFSVELWDLRPRTSATVEEASRRNTLIDTLPSVVFVAQYMDDISPFHVRIAGPELIAGRVRWWVRVEGSRACEPDERDVFPTRPQAERAAWYKASKFGPIVRWSVEGI